MGDPQNHPPPTNRGVPPPRIAPTYNPPGLRNHPGVARGPRPGASCSGRGGWAVDSGVEAHGQLRRTARLGSGGLVTVGPDRVVSPRGQLPRGQLTEGQGPGVLAPLPGPVDELPAWRCLAGREGAGPTRGKGQPYKAVPHREPRSNKGEAGSPGGDLPRADGTLSHSGDPGYRGRGRWQATAKGGNHPTRRGLAGHRPPSKGAQGVRGAPQSLPWHLVVRGKPRRPGSTERGERGPVSE